MFAWACPFVVFSSFVGFSYDAVGVVEIRAGGDVVIADGEQVLMQRATGEQYPTW